MLACEILYFNQSTWMNDYVGVTFREPDQLFENH